MPSRRAYCGLEAGSKKRLSAGILSIQRTSVTWLYEIWKDRPLPLAGGETLLCALPPSTCPDHPVLGCLPSSACASSV